VRSDLTMTRLNSRHWEQTEDGDVKEVPSWEQKGPDVVAQHSRDWKKKWYQFHPITSNQYCDTHSTELFLTHLSVEMKC